MGSNILTTFLFILGLATLVCAFIPLIKLILRTRLTEGRALEVELNNIYMRCQNNLFIGELVLKEIGGLESTEADRIANLMKDVISARYKNISNSNMPAFLTENYPDLRNLAISYDRLAGEIIKRRDAFLTSQDQLAFKIEAFEKWRTATVRAWFFAKDYPDDNLKAIINGRVIATGNAALQKMQQLISSEETNSTYNSGLYQLNYNTQNHAAVTPHSQPQFKSHTKPFTTTQKTPTSTLKPQNSVVTKSDIPAWVQGAIDDRVKSSTVNKNDICPCGSRKKYKNCCGGT